MQFIRPNQRPKQIRTRLYGNQQFTRFELEILHTPILQRLYNLKQLGFADRVYADAIHARFNHILGVAEVVERMATGQKPLAISNRRNLESRQNLRQYWIVAK